MEWTYNKSGFRQNEGHKIEFMNRNIIFILGLIILTSCSREKKIYYKNGNIKKIHFYNKNHLDSTIVYYNFKEPILKKVIKRDKKGLFYISNYSIEGNKKSEGVKNLDSVRIGKWYYYQGDTTKIMEYKNIRGEAYLNQSWVINAEGDTIFGNYALLKKIKDTIGVGDFVSLRFYLKGFFFSKDSELLIILPDIGKNFTSNFSNENSIKKDTIKSLKYDELNQHLKDSLPLNHIAIVNFKFVTPGEKHIRAILTEVERPDNDSVKKLERHIYFDKSFYIK